uniref:Uncharacterized protein n=1 Tax=Tanacetum cinerariifolium TaxID=118510 RepID=A0A6L2LWJ8_TANCI|nr:hypothetical protein [Tanacetum cinerariifolium]
MERGFIDSGRRGSNHTKKGASGVNSNSNSVNVLNAPTETNVDIRNSSALNLADETSKNGQASNMNSASSDMVKNANKVAGNYNVHATNAPTEFNMALKNNQIKLDASKVPIPTGEFGQRINAQLFGKPNVNTVSEPVLTSQVSFESMPTADYVQENENMRPNGSAPSSQHSEPVSYANCVLLLLLIRRTDHGPKTGTKTGPETDFVQNTGPRIGLKWSVHLVEKLVIVVPKSEETGNTRETIRIEYEWKPPRCDEEAFRVVKKGVKRSITRSFVTPQSRFDYRPITNSSKKGKVKRMGLIGPKMRLVEVEQERSQKWVVQMEQKP